MPEPPRPPEESKPQELLDLSASFLNRLSTDQDFATEFDKDPAATLKALHPAFAKVPKKQLDDAVQAYLTERDSALLAAGRQAGESLWFVPPNIPTGALAHALNRVVNAAAELVSAVVAAAVAFFSLTGGAPSIPE